ncbi:hypothetical protein CEXT_88041 [Caerostris extrusa]|uniref:Uncharacterized protein n=1 Tax=Caerostris extrusa TaxID=172846 RepID=A0AAV4T0M7_CAEEX|nr:hypothetical protein CEXT_88041 [Caerostris extrusa]
MPHKEICLKINNARAIFRPPVTFSSPRAAGKEVFGFIVSSLGTFFLFERSTDGVSPKRLIQSSYLGCGTFLGSPQTNSKKRRVNNLNYLEKPEKIISDERNSNVNLHGIICLNEIFSVKKELLLFQL